MFCNRNVLVLFINSNSKGRITIIYAIYMQMKIINLNFVINFLFLEMSVYKIYFLPKISIKFTESVLNIYNRMGQIYDTAQNNIEYHK